MSSTICLFNVITKDKKSKKFLGYFELPKIYGID